MLASGGIECAGHYTKILSQIEDQVYNSAQQQCDNTLCIAFH